MEQAKDGDPQTVCWNLREGWCVLLHDEQHVGQQHEAQRHADQAALRGQPQHQQKHRTAIAEQQQNG